MVGKVKIVKKETVAALAAKCEELRQHSDALNKSCDAMAMQRDGAFREVEFWKRAEQCARETLKDKIALAALTGMLSHGTHHTPDKVMVMVYEFAEAGMNARGNNPEREKYIAAALNEKVSDETGTAEDAAYNRACEDIAAAIRNLK